MKPITRAHLALMVPAGGTVIELGVAAGKFAEEMLTIAPSIQYIGIDRWADHHDEDEMRTAKDRLWPWRDRVGFHRMTFAEAIPKIPDAFADLIYIDGYAHTGQEGGQTLRDWWPKLRPGGIFAGHDYDGLYPETIEAVDAFVAENRLELNVIEELPHSSWWVRKPNAEVRHGRTTPLRLKIKLSNPMENPNQNATPVALDRLVRQSYFGTVRLTIGCMDRMCQVTYYNENREKQDIRGTSKEIADHINSLPNIQDQERR